MPLLFGQYFIFYRFFDLLFIVVMITFFAVRIYERRLFQLHIITVLHVLMAMYVLTVGIVHTFDIDRFITTIYPFILMIAMMSIVYIGHFCLIKFMELTGVGVKKTTV